MEFVQQIKVAKGIFFSFFELSSAVSLGGGGQYFDMFTNPLFDIVDRSSASRERASSREMIL